ncbi:uncharacterized protein LOC113763963 [Coffea eugenioides]|uniref:uncharacterized protein LOC113763963 n=1 Tax=Coffea eugenioides TaxID=49369 RepID=UPI000F60B54E|nr:uncharacterized protein LOC113763963 [Coffea eugenioides]
MELMIILLAVSLFLQGALGELVCEELPIKMCSFAVASTGKRCSLETYAAKDGKIGLQCRSSEILASDNIHEHIEKDECISACGVSRKTVGISSDYLFQPRHTHKICSPKCQHNCLNIVDLYSNLALAEGLYLPGVCKKALESGSRQEMSEIGSSEIAPSNTSAMVNNNNNNTQAYATAHLNVS